MKIFLNPFSRSENRRPSVDTNVVHQVLAQDFSGGIGMLPWQANFYDHVDLLLSEIPECKFPFKPEGRRAGSEDPCAFCACRSQLDDASIRFQERLFAAVRGFGKGDRWFECVRLIGPHQVSRLAMGFTDHTQWAAMTMAPGTPKSSEIEMDRILIQTSFYHYLPPAEKEALQTTLIPTSSGTDEPDRRERFRA